MFSSVCYQMANAVSPGISVKILNPSMPSTCEARTLECYCKPSLCLCKREHMAHRGNSSSLIPLSLPLLLPAVVFKIRSFVLLLVIKYKSPSPIFQRVIKRLSRRSRQDTGIAAVSANRAFREIIHLSLVSHNFKFKQNT